VSLSDVSQFTVFTNTNSSGFLPSIAIGQCYCKVEQVARFSSCCKINCFLIHQCNSWI